jgi:hypothetical protein
MQENGAILQSSHPQALGTVRRILQASSAIPGTFRSTHRPGGKPREELYVDGRDFSWVFLYPPSGLRLGESGPSPVRARLISAAGWTLNGPRSIAAVSIAGSATNAMIGVSGLNDVLRIYAAAKRDRTDFNMSFTGPDFTVKYDRSFQQPDVRSLFKYGRWRALRGDAWVQRPPF